MVPSDTEPVPPYRRIAADLGVTTMALYRHVPGKDELLLLMADSVFGGPPLPEPSARGWRPHLEAAARMQWAMYQRHPWLAQITSFTRPLPAPRAMAHPEWVMRALDGLGLDPVTMIHVHTTLAGYVRGLAANLETEAEAVQDSGITDEQWMDAHVTPAMSVAASRSWQASLRAPSASTRSSSSVSSASLTASTR